MKTLSSLACVAFCCLLWMSCSFSHTNGPDATTLVKTTIAGQVVDESGNALSGATVTAYGKTCVTSKVGTFMFSNIDVPGGRLVIKVTKNGYYPSFRAAEPNVNGLTQVRCGLMSDATTAVFSSAAGSNVSVAGGASIVFPPNGYADANGKPYTGTVRVAARLLSPSATNFYDFFAGDFEAKAADGSSATLLSNGVLRVELSDNAGNKLNLAQGSTAQLSAPLATGMKSTATIPLWYFDEALGMWKEEGFATKQGSNFVGTVQHFSDWNFDWKGDTATLHVRVHCDQDNVPGVNLSVGQRTIVTDSYITNIRRVQADVPIIIKVRPELNNGLESAEQTVGPFVNGQSVDIDVPLTICPAYIKGRLVDCENKPIDGTVLCEYASGGYFFGFASKGEFSIRARSGEDFTVYCIAPDGRESDKVAVVKLNASEKRDIGTFMACGNASVAFRDVDIQESGSVINENRVMPVKLSRDGSTLYTFSKKGLSLWDVASGNLKKTISIPAATNDSLETTDIDLSDDESTVLIPINYGTWSTYDLASGNQLQTFSANLSVHLSADGSKVVSGVYTYDNTTQKSRVTITVSNARTGQVLNTITTLNGAELETLSSLSDFVNNNQFALVQGRSKNSVDSKLYVINALDGSVANSFDVGGQMINAFSPDGSIVATWNYLLNAVQYSFYNLSTGTRISTVNPQVIGYPRYALAIHPDNQRFASTAGVMHDSVTVTGLFSIANGLLLKPMVTPVVNVRMNSMCFSADGKYLAAIYCENNAWKVRVWTL